ncbi:hypothetical protein DPMN_054423 [Dreissena polymorpha]|uniref:Uncharacterized protein n=1 Tax=Dreissena polymorpha TaxID=45954 RepID=A0A9D4CQN4_DREPO|nr:hypothetical protein DPMN_054423 [Dreissena polymorpha]
MPQFPKPKRAIPSTPKHAVPSSEYQNTHTIPKIILKAFLPSSHRLALRDG